VSAEPARTPPRVARSLLRSLLPGDVRDEIDGDLHELYLKRRTDRGAGVAVAWYWIVTLSFIMRFTFDRLARALRSLASGNAAPSVLDVKLGARILAKSPGLSLVGGLGIAVAVALGAAGYAVVNSYSYPDVPLDQGDRLVALTKFDPQARREEERLLHDFLVWRRELRTITDVGAFRTIRRNLVSESGQGEPITLAEMTATGFRAARVPPLRGRVLIDADEQPGAPAVVVIGYDVWQSRFAGDRSIVGRELRIGRETHTIVGVMPEGFAFPVSHRYWVPLRIDPRAVIAPGTGPSLNVFGRLTAGATRESAEAELRVVTRRSSIGEPPELAALKPRVLPYTEVFMHGEVGGSNETMAAARFMLALFLLVVSMNVGVLVYARTIMRTGEIAIRTALGATRSRIVAQLFAEAFVLSGVSSLVGLAVVAVGLRMFDAALADMLDGDVPFWMHAGVSFGTVVYTLALALLAAVIVGVFPALRATGAKLRGAMGSLGSGAKAQLGATWTVLIVAQVAITVAFLPPALLKGWEVIQEASRPPSFTAGEYLATQFVVESDAQPAAIGSESDAAAADSARAIMRRFIARLAIEPGVAGASITTGAPWEGIGAALEADGRVTEAKRAVILNVDTSFFSLFGVRMLAGRSFTASDVPLRYADRPVIVSRSFVTEILGGGQAIGRRVRYRSLSKDPQPWLTIAGVVEDLPPAIRNASESTKRGARMYQLAMPGDLRDALLTIRLSGQTPETFMPALRRIATSVDPMLQLSHMSTLDAMYRDYTKGGAQLALVAALVTAVVILLSGAGIHALMSFAVNQRRREIGIRAALGAPPSRILRSVLIRATRQLALGLGIGLVVTVAINRASGGATMSGTGLVLVPVTVALMLVVGLLAATGPARRGLRVQPTEALRAE
jgi:putative ABC transport system permease protein